MKTRHRDIIEYYLEQHLDKLETSEEAKDLSEKLNAVIERLIHKEGILIITEDNDESSERVLSLNVNYDAPLFD